MSLSMPNGVPETGFYYHYKHDSSGEVNNYAYEVLSVGTHTETNEKLIIYRSLYQNKVQDTTNYWVRPLEMWFENIEKEGKTIPRFQKITDEDVIRQLEEIRDQMY